jgi:hypothetical protein
MAVGDGGIRRGSDGDIRRNGNSGVRRGGDDDGGAPTNFGSMMVVMMWLTSKINIFCIGYLYTADTYYYWYQLC